MQQTFVVQTPRHCGYVGRALDIIFKCGFPGKPDIQLEGAGEPHTLTGARLDELRMVKPPVVILTIIGCVVGLALGAVRSFALPDDVDIPMGEVTSMLPMLVFIFSACGWQVYTVRSYVSRLRAVAEAPGGNGLWSIVTRWSIFRNPCGRNYGVIVGDLAIYIIWRNDTTPLLNEVMGVQTLP
jgi:hypothetical protein